MTIAVSPMSDQVVSTGKNLPVLERAYTEKELKVELATVSRTRRVIIGSVWTIAVAVMIYGMINVTPFLIDHGVNPWIAPGLPLMVDVGLAASIWGDKLVRKYGVKDGWITTLRWGTAIMTWALNIARPLAGAPGLEWRPDWVGVMVHSCGPIMLILVTEAANSFGAKATTIVQTLSKAEQDEAFINSERNKMMVELEDGIKTRDEQINELRENLEELSIGTDGFTSHIESLAGSNSRLMELITSNTTSTETNSIMGQAIIGQFAKNMDAAPGLPILAPERSTGNEKSDLWGHRLVTTRSSSDTLFLVDSMNPIVSGIMEQAEDFKDGVSKLPKTRIISLMDYDIGSEMFDMLREKGALKADERNNIIHSVNSGEVSRISDEVLTRIIIRSALATNKIS